MNEPNKIQALINNIISAKTLENSKRAKEIAEKTIDNEIERLSRQRSMLDRYEKFAIITGETYTLPEHIATWLDKSVIVHAYNENQTKLENANVSEYNGRRWICTTDGIRLHAHVTDLPVGTYCIVGNQLRLAPEQKYPKWQEVLPVEPTTVTLEDYKPVEHHDDYTFAAWKIVGTVLTTPAKDRDANYWINESFLKEAWSLPSQEEPEYAKDNSTYKTPLLLRWPDAMALIMPANLDR